VSSLGVLLPIDAVLIPSYANRVQHVQISEYLLIRNCIAIKSAYQFFYYHNKYLNSMKCLEISMGPSKCTIQCTLFGLWMSEFENKYTKKVI
jgi:hypothetical protein